ncbi:MAG: RNA polymerase sigma factor [Chloroflexia bacterium]
MAEPAPEVVRRAQAGDEAALTELVRSQQNYVYSIALGIFRNPDEAADVTQEAFLRLFQVLPTFRGETRFTTWLYRLVVNLCYDELRRQKRRPVGRETAEEALEQIPETAPWADPDLGAERTDVQEQVRRALAQLDEPYRTALILFYFRDLKYREIAEIMGLPINTVKSHIHRAKARLAELLDGNEKTAVPAHDAHESAGVDAPVRGSAVLIAGRPR